MTIMMAPSILSANFMDLGNDVAKISDGGADYIHFDVMDGHFVPNLTLGVPFVKAMKKITSKPLDVHLMISNPGEQIDWYLQAGADLATIHIEACENSQECAKILKHIKDAGAKCGVSLNPETPASEIEGLVDIVDVILVMSVHPGFGGQSFISSSPAKVCRIQQMCEARNSHPIIEVDGGINKETAPLVTSMGATMLVAGSAIFGQPDPVKAMEDIRISGQGAIEA